MHTHFSYQERDLCYCIYEFIKCERNLDCINCEIAIRYWEDIKKSIEKKMDFIPENVDLLKERVTG